MELNALMSWESIGKDLYERGLLGHEIAILKERSKQVERHRTERQQQRSEVEETINSTATTNTSSPSSSPSTAPSKWNSRTQLDQLEQEETMLAKFRQLREGGKVLQKEEEKLEQSVFGNTLELFPPGHQRWVYFLYRTCRRFAKGFAFGYFGKFAFGFLGLVLRHKLNLSKLLPEISKLMVKPELFKYGGFLGSFLMLFESVMRLLRMKNYLSQNHRSVRIIASACVASAVSITFLPKSARLGISMFFLVRALEVLVRWGAEEKEKAYITRQHRRGGSALGEEWTTRADNKSTAISFIGGGMTTSSGSQLAIPMTTMMHDLALESAAVNNANAQIHTQTSEGGLSITLTDASSFASPEGSPLASIISSPKHESGSLVVDTQASSSESTLLSSLSNIGSRLKRSLVRISKLPISYHFDTLVMGLASAQVIWAWLYNRSTIDSSYLHFLDVQGGKAPAVRKAFVALSESGVIPSTVLTQVNTLRATEGFEPLDLTLPLPSLIHSLVHKDATLLASLLQFFKEGYFRALPVYLPVYILPMLIFKHRQLFRAPLKVIVPTILNTARSSIFLSSYCTLVWGVPGLITQQLGVVSPLLGAITGFFSGLTVTLEQKGRRRELALYVLSKALPSLALTLQGKRFLPHVPHADSLCFVAAMAVIMWSYVTRPHLLRSSYLSLFKFFFGSGGKSAGFSVRAVEHSTPKAKIQPPIKEVDSPTHLALDSSASEKTEL